jgi:hypothetical protein
MTKSTKIGPSVARIKMRGVARFAAIVHSPLPAEHSFYGLVGRVAAEWAQLEHVLDIAIWELSGIDPAAGSCITSQLGSYAARFKALVALSNHRGLDEKFISRIKTLQNKVGELAEKRARIVHDAWYIEVGTDSVSQFKSLNSKNNEFGMNSIEEATILDLVERIRGRISMVHSLRADMLSAIRL